MANALNKVNSDGVEDGSIVNADLNASAAIATSKLSGAVTGIASHGLAASATTDTTNADNIGSGTLAAARVATLNQNTTGTSGGFTAGDASNLNAGTVAVARLGSGTGSSSNYLRGDGSWQAVPAGYDDQNVRHDLSMLALHIANTDNKAAFDLANSTIDYFEDENSMATKTDITYDATNEWWKSGGETDVASNITAFTASGLTNLAGWPGNTLLTNDDNDAAFHTDSSGIGSYFRIDLGQARAINRIRLYTDGPQSCNWEVQRSASDGSWGDSGWDMNVSGVNGWTEVSGTAQNYRYWRFDKTTSASGGGYHRRLEMYVGSVTATGTGISDAYTATSARTKVAGVLLYKNIYGSATLGTDLKVYFSCNGGSNWTEVTSFTPNSVAFKSGIFSVNLGEVTCTSGTSIKYKLEWANQSAGSKETGVQGIALQY